MGTESSSSTRATCRRESRNRACSTAGATTSGMNSTTSTRENGLTIKDMVTESKFLKIKRRDRVNSTIINKVSMNKLKNPSICSTKLKTDCLIN